MKPAGYVVVFSRAHHADRVVGPYESLSEALRAARALGAIIPRNKARRVSHPLSVRGRRRNDDYAVWILEATNP